MPSLIRFVIILSGLAALVYGGLYFLANEVKIAPHEITQTVDLPKAPK
ncbi:MAG TPA: histidine kinase [Roseiarcus sp.]|nr:histidine kinase [Roseiarcus sp.]